MLTTGHHAARSTQHAKATCLLQPSVAHEQLVNGIRLPRAAGGNALGAATRFVPAVPFTRRPHNDECPVPLVPSGPHCARQAEWDRGWVRGGSTCCTVNQTCPRVGVHLRQKNGQVPTQK